MNARDFKRKTASKERFETPHPVGKKPGISIWDRLSDIRVATPTDRVKFLIVFIIIGLGCIFLGDIFKLITFRGTGIAMQIVGWLVIAAGFIVPFAKIIEDDRL
jgi:hypothetical protein